MSFRSSSRKVLTIHAGNQSSAHATASACGACDVYVPEVRIAYFPDGPVKSCTPASKQVGLFAESTPPVATTTRAHGNVNGSLENAASTAVVDGYTL